MRMVCWGLLGISVIFFLIGIYSKFVGPQGSPFGFAAIAWWRGSLSFAVYAIALKMVHGNGKA